MRRRRRSVVAVAAASTTLLIVVLVGAPIALLGAGGLGSPPVACAAAGTPFEELTILGPALRSDADLRRWATTDDRFADAGVSTSVAALADLYLLEGRTEGVRGDVAFAQAVLETGAFTSGGARANNFAGIGHYDGRRSGHRFASPAEGVRAHIQLLKKYAAGNDTALTNPDVAPDAGARATTWVELAGTWASDPAYGDALASIVRSTAREHVADGADLIGSAMGREGPCPVAVEEGDADRAATAGGSFGLAVVGGITVNEAIAEPLAALLREAAADGVQLAGWGHRSHQRQIELRREHCGTTDYAVYEMPSSQCSPPTARPGSSMHEKGLAIDFENCSTHETRCYGWLAANAAAFGLYNLPSEPWHWSTTGT